MWLQNSIEVNVREDRVLQLVRPRSRDGTSVPFTGLVSETKVSPTICSKRVFLYQACPVLMT
jgi:hypothetical protein